MTRMRSRHATCWTVANRTAAAVVGGYVVTSLATACLARLLPMRAVEATLAATLASFLIGAVLVMWVFAARSSVRVWLSLAVLGLILGAVAWLSMQLGGRV